MLTCIAHLLLHQLPRGVALVYKLRDQLFVLLAPVAADVAEHLVSEERQRAHRTQQRLLERGGGGGGGVPGLERRLYLA